jgi:hypothetical protein
LLSTGLGSTSAMSSSSGQLVGEVTRYYPFGAYRSGGPNDITDSGFTGQKENMELGLYYYNARYYVIKGRSIYLYSRIVLARICRIEWLNTTKKRYP